MGGRHIVVQGDSRRLARVADGSIHLVVTSPPYWQLKDYGAEGQIGYHDTYQAYVNNLNLVWQECVRSLAPGGRVCVNVGDQFARSAHYGRYKVVPIRTEIVRFLETAGLDHMGSIIWQKVTTCNTSGGATIMGSFPYPPNGVVKVDYEYILLFRKPGRRPDTVSAERKQASRLTTEQWNTYFYGHWNFKGERQDRHLAAYPPELPRRLVRMFTFVGDRVLDPFLGSGTTTLVAHEEGRDSVGYEINPEFVALCRERLRGTDGLFGAAEVEFLEDPLPPEVGFERLPYVFEDPVRIDRKRGRPLETYGSKVNGSERGRGQTFKVAAVPAHDRIVLADGREVALLGVGALLADAGSAVRHLSGLCLGKRVTLENDPAVGDGEGLPVYVHLPNRKFINGHMIRSGLVAPDLSRDYRHRRRFGRYAREAAGGNG